MSKQFLEACVHGRFQPPHNEHVDYVRKAFELSIFLWIGLTEYDIRNLVECDLARHRSQAFANPLTFFERVSIWTEILRDFGYDRGSFGFLPFPVDRPNLLNDFLDRSIPCLTTICDRWNIEKIRRLRSCGYSTFSLMRRRKSIEGCYIRNCIRRGDKTWESLVPIATKDAVYGLDLQRRLGTELES